MKHRPVRPDTNALPQQLLGPGQFTRPVRNAGRQQQCVNAARILPQHLPAQRFGLGRLPRSQMPFGGRQQFRSGLLIDHGQSIPVPSGKVCGIRRRRPAKSDQRNRLEVPVASRQCIIAHQLLAKERIMTTWITVAALTAFLAATAQAAQTATRAIAREKTSAGDLPLP